MRVLVDSLPLLGEASIGGYLRQLLTHLFAVEKGHEYELFLRGFRKDTRLKARRILTEPPVNRFKTHITRIPDFILEWCWTRRSLHLPFTEAWLGNPDVFLSTIYLTPVIRRAATVMIAYDLIPFRFPQLYLTDQPLLAARIRRGIERSHSLIAISECTKRDFVELMGADQSRVHVIYPAAEARFTHQGDEELDRRMLAGYGIQKPYLLYVGSLGPHKNVETLIRVFRRLKAHRRVPHTLVLCGPARWGASLMKSCGDLLDSKACLVLDFVPAAHLPALYRGADLFAFLSLYEGFGLPPLEAMASGIPVVTSNAGSLPEVVGDAAVQVPPTDEDAIEEALYRVLIDSDLHKTLRERGLQQAARFSWSAAATRILDVLKRASEVT